MIVRKDNILGYLRKVYCKDIWELKLELESYGCVLFVWLCMFFFFVVFLNFFKYLFYLFVVIESFWRFFMFYILNFRRS